MGIRNRLVKAKGNYFAIYAWIFLKSEFDVIILQRGQDFVDSCKNKWKFKISICWILVKRTSVRCIQNNNSRILRSIKQIVLESS